MNNSMAKDYIIFPSLVFISVQTCLAILLCNVFPRVLFYWVVEKQRDSASGWIMNSEFIDLH